MISDIKNINDKINEGEREDKFRYELIMAGVNDIIIDFYYGLPIVVKTFIAAATYYISNKIICKLSETMIGYQS